MPVTIALAPPTLRRSPAQGARPAIVVAAGPASLPHVGIPRLAVPLLVLALAAALALGALATLAPSPALGATSMTARCDGISLRTKPKTTATRKARINEGADVVAVAIVSGGKWTTTCNGSSSTGRSWYRISSVNGKSVSRLYGRTYVYAATSLFRVTSAPVTKQATCGVRLRTGTSADATAKARLSAGTKVTVAGSFTGGRWTTTCNGDDLSGHGWYRVTAVNSKSVYSLYGVRVLYAAKKLFRTPTTSTEVTPTPTPTPTPKAGYIEGIDVSHWQGTINWTKVAGAGKKFVFMKASEGRSYVDPTYATNRAQAKSNGLLVGAYHFAKPDDVSGDAVAEADHFIETAAWVPGEMLPVLDLEVTGGLGTSKLQNWTKAFLDRIFNRTGIRSIIYTSPYFWSSNMGNTTAFATAGYKTLWVAHWTTASSPSVPASNWGGNGWTFWQYTSDGSVAGIDGRVDLDRYKLADFDPVLIK